MYRIRSYRFVSLASSVLLIAPFGFGLPYGMSVLFGPSAGALLLLFLLAPSVIGAALLARRIGTDTTVIALPIIGCAAPVIGYFVFMLSMVAVDTSCERWSLVCRGVQLWGVFGLLWTSIVLASVWLASVNAPSRA